MKLNKNTQIILGVGALAVLGYFVWKNNNKKNADGKLPEDEGVRSNRVTLNPDNYPKNPKKANASGEGFTASVMIPCQFMVAQRDWKIVGNYKGETLYLDSKGIYHWFTKVSGKDPKTNKMTTYCYENTSSDNPLKFTPKK